MNISNSLILFCERLKNPYKIGELLNESNPKDLMYKDCSFISNKGQILPYSYDVRRVNDFIRCKLLKHISYNILILITIKTILILISFNTITIFY